jgi:hypothetical protein
MVNLIEQSNWLGEDQTANMRYVIELYDGRRGQADTALSLFDLLCAPDYSDCDDRVTQIMLLCSKLKDVAAYDLSTREIRTQVFSGMGLFFDNGAPKHQDETEEAGAIRFTNEQPLILDAWDEWTTMASLIQCGYLKLYEKAHQLTSAEQVHQARNFGVFTTMLGSPDTEDEQGYWEVTPDKVSDEPLWIPNYVPLSQRT